MSNTIDQIYATNKWERKNLRKKIEKKREIGAYFRTKGTKTNKHKLQKHRRSKRRYLIQSSKDYTRSFIDDCEVSDMVIENELSFLLELRHFHIAGSIEYGQSPTDWSDSTVQRRVNYRQYEGAYQKYKLCIICNEHHCKDTLLGINCGDCRDYLHRNGLDVHGVDYRRCVCRKCADDVDICTTSYEREYPYYGKDDACDFCDSLSPRITCSGSTCHKNIRIQRTNKLFEPVEYEYLNGACGYEISDRENPYTRCRYIAYCHNCINYSVTKLSKCKVHGCNNMDNKQSVCANHRCHICLKFPSVPNYSRYYENKSLECCSDCNRPFCFPDKDKVKNTCGSLIDGLCKHCFVKKEEESLKNAIFSYSPFPSDICFILLQYARGFMFECHGCEENSICIDSVLTLEKYNQQIDIDGKAFYYYLIENAEAIQRHKQYLANANGKFFRIFCHKCDGSLTKCMHWRRCSNREVKTISLDKLRNGGEQSSTCFAHNSDLVPFGSINECSTCSQKCEEDIFDIDYDYYWWNPNQQNKIDKAKEWLNEMIECKHCNKRFCKECQENGTLGEYLSSKLQNSLHVCFNQNTETMSKNQCGICLKRKISKEWIARLKYCEVCDTHVCAECDGDGLHDERCHQGFNECLMDYDFLMNSNQKKRMLKKKYNKNHQKRKSKSYWIRKNDKRGNRKNKKRLNQRSLLLFMLRNEI